MPVYPQDIFDSASSRKVARTGAHRAARRFGPLARGLIFLLLLLIVVGLANFAMRILDGKVQFLSAAEEHKILIFSTADVY